MLSTLDKSVVLFAEFISFYHVYPLCIFLQNNRKKCGLKLQIQSGFDNQSVSHKTVPLLEKCLAVCVATVCNTFKNVSVCDSCACGHVYTVDELNMISAIWHLDGLYIQPLHTSSWANMTDCSCPSCRMHGTIFDNLFLKIINLLKFNWRALILWHKFTNNWSLSCLRTEEQACKNKPH